jgi:PhnB protein
MQLIPHFRFNDDKCREAFNFYNDAFGGKAKIEIQTLGESPMAKEMPKESHNKVMHATFKLGGIEFAGADSMRDKAIVGDQVSMMINCDSEEQLNAIFKKLEVGGDVFMAPEKQFWGAIFGMVTDKYGIEWNLNYPLENK